MGSVHNVTDPEFLRVGSDDVCHIPRDDRRPPPCRRRDRGAKTIAEPPQWDEGIKNISSAANQNPCISEAFLVGKWPYPFAKLRIKRIDEQVIRQQALNNGAAMLIVG
jgi:hypothetical protein